MKKMFAVLALSLALTSVAAPADAVGGTKYRETGWGCGGAC